jgi:hypothetical protein
MKLSSWYAYQYKVDPHWLIQTFNYSPEASRITTWHTHVVDHQVHLHGDQSLAVRGGVMAGASPDTIKLDPQRSGSCPTQGSLAPVCIAIVDQSTNMTYRGPTDSTSMIGCRRSPSTCRPVT